MDKVLVTGGTGFIGLHCIQQLLDSGYEVRTTIRTESRKEEVIEAMRKHSSNPERLEVVIADLLKDDGWNEDVSGCRYVLHIASPFFLEIPENENILIKPAVEGTLRVLNACKENKVKKVVLTSSVAAIGYGHVKDKKIFDENDWSQTDEDISPYAKSKTLAEKTAWNFIKELSNENRFELTVINPVAVTGPMLSDDIAFSNHFLLKLANGLMPACPRIQMGFVDVRDVAKAHIFSMTSEKTNGERIITSQKEMFFVEASRVLNDAGFKKAPKREMPDFLVRFMALFVKELGGLLPSLGRERNTNKSKARALFDWDYIPAEESIIESTKQLQSMGLI
jgi:dihydroflavonol-4-reductase